MQESVNKKELPIKKIKYPKERKPTKPHTKKFKPKEDKYTFEQMESAFRSALGVKVAVAKILGCSYRTVSNYAEKYPELEDIKDEMLQRMLDNAELKLQKKIEENNLTAVIFFLKTKGKNRGYTERVESTGKEGGAIHIIDETNY